MKAAGVTGKRGREMRYSGIYEILRNEKYTGVYLYSVQEESDRAARRSKPAAIRIENALPVIIEREMWERVQTVMNNNKNVGKGAKRTYLLSGIAYCGQCGAPMHGLTTHRTKNGRTYTYSYYTCSQKCGNKNAHLAEVESQVLRYASELASPENRALLHTLFARHKDEMQAAVVTDSDYTKKEIAERQSQIDAMMQNMSTNVLPAAVLENMGKKITELQQQIDLLTGELEKPLTFDTSLLDSYFDSVEKLDTADPALQREFVRHFIDRVDIMPNAVNVSSTLTAFLEKHGCGGRI